MAHIGAEVGLLQITDVTNERTVLIHKLWDTDIVGFKPIQPTPEEAITFAHYLDTVEYIDGQY